MRFLIDQVRAVLKEGPVGENNVSQLLGIVCDSMSTLKEGPLYQRDLSPGRYLLYKDPDFGFVIMMMVWGKGVCTPIHDHGTWGVEGVLKNRVHITTYTPCQETPKETSAAILPEGSVTYILPPNVDVHKVAHYSGDNAVTIHIYGKAMLANRVYIPGEGYRPSPLETCFIKDDQLFESLGLEPTYTCATSA